MVSKGRHKIVTTLGTLDTYTFVLDKNDVPFRDTSRISLGRIRFLENLQGGLTSFNVPSFNEVHILSFDEKDGFISAIVAKPLNLHHPKPIRPLIVSVL